MTPSKKILVTGCAGFIGSWVADALLREGYDVVGVDNFNDYYDPALKRARAKKIEGRALLIEADVSDAEAMEKVFREHRIDQVCHLAAQAGVRNSLERPFSYEKSNVLGTLVLLEACKKHQVNSFIYASSSSVYGGNKKVPFSEEDPVEKPISLYAATKRSCELMAYTYHHLFGLHCTGLRFFTVYGPWGRPDMAYYKFTKAIRAGEPIDVYNHGKMRRDFTYISDIVDGVLAALRKDAPCEIFNLGNSHAVDLMTFIRCIEDRVGRKAEVRFRDLPPGDVFETWADIRKSTDVLGFSPKVMIKDGVASFVEWFESYYGPSGDPSP